VLLRMLSPWPSAANKKTGGGRKSGTATPPCLLTQQTQGHHRNSSASTQSGKQGRCIARQQTLKNGKLAHCKIGRNFFLLKFKKCQKQFYWEIFNCVWPHMMLTLMLH
jgi:hypothetical protein